MATMRVTWWSRPPATCARLSPMPTNERGFTLVETLIALVIMTVALVGLAQLMVVSAQMHQVGRTSAEASRLAQDKFEELMKLNFALAPGIQISGNNTLDANVANYFDVPANSGYTRRWRVQAGPGGIASLRTVTVRMVRDVRLGTDYEVTTVLRSW